MLCLLPAKAEAFKEEGNYEYKKKQFKKAILAYTEGIKARSSDKNLNAILYTNRATVNFTIGKQSGGSSGLTASPIT